MQDDGPETVTLDIDSSGVVFAKSQLSDYSYRGEELANFNFLDFLMDTYEVEIANSEREKPANVSTRDGDEHRGPGRPRNARFRYLSLHPKAKSVQRILRSHGHRNLPNFIGRWFPRSDDKETRDFYCASMLALLKPWRDLGKDLKWPDQTWEGAFDDFLNNASWKEERVISGLQYFHECTSAAATANDSPGSTAARQLLQGEEDGFPEDEDSSPLIKGLSEEGLAALKADAVPYREQLHGLLAIEVARRAKIFDDMPSWSSTTTQPPRNPTDDDLQRISSWANQLQADVERQNTKAPPPPTQPTQTPSIEPLSDHTTPTANISPLSHVLTSSEEALDGLDVSHLRPDQA